MVTLIAIVALLGVAAPTSTAWAGVALAGAYNAPQPPDELILKDGRIVKGEFIEETDTQITFRVMVGSIAAVRSYSKTDVLHVVRGETDTQAGSQADTGTKPAEPKIPAVAINEQGQSVYVMELSGQWGWDIAEKSIRDMLRDAQRHKPDIVVLVINARYTDEIGQELSDDIPEPFNIFGVREIEPIFSREVPMDWGYTPRWVVWVKNAMGGIAMLPLNFREIYFHPDARMGGQGYLIYNWGQTGSEVTREKLISASLAHAEGMAIKGGYDPRIVKAMSDMRFVLSYRMEGGRPVFLERMPESPDEYLLTDDGTNEETADNMLQRVRGEGNDWLTLRADIAQTLGVSKGTVRTLDELLWELGISRTARVLDSGSGSERVARRWADELTRARRQFPIFVEEFNRIEVQGDFNERRSARSRQIAKLEELIRHIRRYDGVMYPQQFGIPTEPELRTMIEGIRQDQIRDRR